MDFCSLDLLLSFETGFSCKTAEIMDILDDEKACAEFHINEVKWAIEAQNALQNSKVISSDKISDHLELTFSMDQGDPILNGIITK